MKAVEHITLEEFQCRLVIGEVFIEFERSMREIPTLINVHKKELVKAGYKDFLDWSSHPDRLYNGRKPYTTKKYGKDCQREHDGFFG